MGDRAGGGAGGGGSGGAGDEAALLQSRLAALRSAGAGRIDPAGFRYLEALSRRLGEQPPPVRQLLQEKLRAALADYAGRAEVPPTAAAAPRPAGAGPAPLAALNRYIEQACLARRQQASAPGAELPGAHELASAQRFQQAWASRRRQDRVAQAATRRPAQAGPLNSHGLVLQSLALMDELSPQYLQQFVMHAETLQWLAAAGEKPATGKTRATPAGRRGRKRS